MGQMKIDFDGTIVEENHGIKKLYWGWQIKERQVYQKEIIAVPDTSTRLVCCAECGAVWRYNGQKYCGGCGSKIKVMEKDKYIKWVEEHEHN